MEVIVYTLTNPIISRAIHTKPVILHEIIVFILGEQLILGPTEKYAFDDRMLEYLVSCLDPLDKVGIDGNDNVTLIYTELNNIVERLQQDYVFKSLMSGGEVYLKYDYEIGRKFSRIRLFSDEPMGTSDFC